MLLCILSQSLHLEDLYPRPIWHRSRSEGISELMGKVVRVVNNVVKNQLQWMARDGAIANLRQVFGIGKRKWRRLKSIQAQIQNFMNA
jgi:hypothetical protein